MRKPLSGPVYFTTILLWIIILGSGCTKIPTLSTNVTVPSVVTLNVVSAVSQTSAQSGGVVTANGGGDIINNGVCYSSTNQTPTIANSLTSDPVNVNGWVSTLSGLSSGTTYYIRAYATNSAGVGYGAVVSFTTSTSSGSLTSTVTTLAGNASSYGFANGTGAAALFDGPQQLAFNPLTGNIYVADVINNAIRTMTTTGVVSTYSNPKLGYIDGPISQALFYGPGGMAFDATGNAYVADLGNNVIRKITPAGVVSTFAGNGMPGYYDGSGSIVMFNQPTGLALDASGNIYVADRGNNLIRKITPAGLVSTYAGIYPLPGGHPTTGYIDADSTFAQFNIPTSVAVDASGNVYVADQGNRAIRMIAPGARAVTTIAGNPVQKYVVGAPVGITIDAKGDLFIADASGRILEISAAKVLYTLAGTYNTSGYLNGTGAAALFNDPCGIAVDLSGNVYVSDFYNNCIRKIVPAQ